MNGHEITINNLDEIDDKATNFLEKINGQKILAFYGEMGAGKTTFIKALCKKLKVTDEVTSPTFAIVNEYSTSENYKVFHFDFYRIKKEDEIYDFGYEEYISGNDYCLMEWPEMAESLLPFNTLRVYLTIGGSNKRILKF